MRITAARARSPAHTASAMLCLGKKLCIPSYVEALHHPKRGTTAARVAVQWTYSLQDRGLKPTPSETTYEVRREAQRIITSVQQNNRPFPDHSIPEFITLQGDLKAKETGRILPREIHRSATVSFSLSCWISVEKLLHQAWSRIGQKWNSVAWKKNCKGNYGDLRRRPVNIEKSCLDTGFLTKTQYTYLYILTDISNEFRSP